MEKWKDKLKAIMMLGTEETFGKDSLELRQKHCKSLFKYCSFSDNSVKSLEGSYVHLSEFNEVNDPAECFVSAGNHTAELVEEIFAKWKGVNELFPSKDDMKMFISRIKYSLDTKSVFVDEIKKRYPKSYESIINDTHFNQVMRMLNNYDSKRAAIIKEKTSENYLIGCLSEKKDIITMWSHYADSHKGFVLEYKLTPLQMIRCFPVFYVSTPLDFDYFEKYKPFYYLMCLKFRDWRKEREWRIIRHKDDGNEFTAIPKAIYFGMRDLDAKNEKDIHKFQYRKRVFDYINENKKIKTYKMRLDTKDYKLTAKPFSLPQLSSPCG